MPIGGQAGALRLVLPDREASVCRVRPLPSINLGSASCGAPPSCRMALRRPASCEPRPVSVADGSPPGASQSGARGRSSRGLEGQGRPPRAHRPDVLLPVVPAAS
ncbi:conserved hypothetical protein, partial [Ricinus communis]